MRLFRLVRDHDISGISGTGTVAEGIQFTDGTVAVRWIVGGHRSTVIWESVADVEAVHGHDGATVVQWLHHGFNEDWTLDEYAALIEQLTQERDAALAEIGKLVNTNADDEYLAMVEKQRARALATIERVKALHTRSTTAHVCRLDQQPWPCPTIRAIDATP